MAIDDPRIANWIERYGDRLRERASIRLFVSSVFRDTERERELLARMVFPQLRATCARRGLAFHAVDLRWGVPADELDEARLLRRLSAEIDGCLPFILGILGGAYGTQLRSERSITEYEICYALKADREIPALLLAYSVPPDPVDGEDAKQAALRTHVRMHASLWRERGSDPLQTARMIHGDLAAIVERLWTLPCEDDARARRRAAQRAHVRVHAGRLIGRTRELAMLDAYAANGDRPMIVTGPEGCGKTTLLAAWAERHDAFFHSQRVDGGEPTQSTLRSIADALGVDAPDMGKEPELLGLRRALRTRDPAHPWVVIVDQVDRLAQLGGGIDLRWMRALDAPAVRVVIGACDDPSLHEQAATFGWPVLRLDPLPPRDSGRFIAEGLARNGKVLDAAGTDALRAGLSDRVPLYQQAVLEELIDHGDFRTVAQEIVALTSQPDLAALYRLLFLRMEARYDGPNPGLIRQILRLLYFSEGLMEHELLELVDAGDRSAAALAWSALRHGIRHALVEHGGVVRFGPEAAFRVVGEDASSDPSVEASMRRRLASYFLGTDARSDRGMHVALKQLVLLSDWPALAVELTDLPRVLALHRSHPHQAIAFCAALKRVNGRALEALFLGALADPSCRSMEVLCRLESLSSSLGESHAALLLGQHKLALAEDPNAIALAQADLAVNFSRVGAWDEAAFFAYRALAAAQALQLPRLTAQACSVLASAFAARGKTAEAMQANEAAIAYARAGEDEVRELECLGWLATEKKNHGLHAGSNALLLEALRDVRRAKALAGRMGDPGRRTLARSTEASILAALGRTEEANAAFGEIVMYLEHYGDQHGARATRHNWANALGTAGDLAGAGAILEELIAACSADGDAEGLGLALDALGNVWFSSGDFERARELCARAIAVLSASGHLGHVRLIEQKLARLVL